MKNFKIAVCIALTLGLHQQINSLPDVDVKSKEVGVKEVNKPGSKPQEPSAEEKNLINQDSLKNKDNSSKKDSQASSPIDTTATKKTGLAGKMNYVYKRSKEGMQAVSKTASNAVSTVSNAFSFAKPEADNTSSQVTSISAAEPTKTTSDKLFSSESENLANSSEQKSSSDNNNTQKAKNDALLKSVDDTVNLLKKPDVTIENSDRYKKDENSGIITNETLLSDGSKIETKFNANGDIIESTSFGPLEDAYEALTGKSAGTFAKYERSKNVTKFNSDGTITVISDDGTTKTFKNKDELKSSINQKLSTENKLKAVVNKTSSMDSQSKANLSKKISSQREEIEKRRAQKTATENQDGSKTTNLESKDGLAEQTVTSNKDELKQNLNKKTTTVENQDGSKTTTLVSKDGSAQPTVTSNKDGSVKLQDKNGTKEFTKDEAAAKKTGISGKLNWLKKRSTEAYESGKNLLSSNKKNQNNSDQSASLDATSQPVEKNNSTKTTSDSTSQLFKPTEQNQTANEQLNSQKKPMSLRDAADKTVQLFNIPESSIQKGEARHYNPDNVSDISGNIPTDPSKPLMSKITLKDGSTLRTYFDNNGNPRSSKITNTASSKPISDISYNPDGTVSHTSYNENGSSPKTIKYKNMNEFQNAMKKPDSTTNNQILFK